MAIYIGLIVYILALPAIVGIFCRDQDKKNKYVTLFGMVAIFLLLALKGDVGSDISSYKSVYEITANKAWDDYDYVYFESGYIFLMKVFNHIGASFQTFMAFVYGLACVSVYLFIRKYSINPTFSMIIFICYDFFVFYISGVRQCIAMSICLIAYIVFQKKKPIAYIFSVLLVIGAILVHKSAIIFLPMLALAIPKSKRINIFVYVAGLLAAYLLRPYMWNFINENLSSVDTTQEITLGGNFIFVIGIALFLFFVNSETNLIGMSFAKKDLVDVKDTTTIVGTRALLFGVSVMLALSGDTLMRAAMYNFLFMIVALPNTTWKFDIKTRVLLELLFIGFFVALFYLETLKPNLLELIPYKFFWNE